MFQNDPIRRVFWDNLNFFVLIILQSTVKGNGISISVSVSPYLSVFNIYSVVGLSSGREKRENSEKSDILDRFHMKLIMLISGSYLVFSPNFAKY